MLFKWCVWVAFRYLGQILFLLQAPVMVEDCEGCEVFSSLPFNHRERVSAIGRVARRVVPDPKFGRLNLCTSFILSTETQKATYR